jgi:hypothetical protein
VKLQRYTGFCLKVVSHVVSSPVLTVSV